MLPADLKYTNDHEWIRISGDSAEVGITDYAQRQLGDVVFVELPEVGTKLTKGEPFGTIESVKAVSELFLPMSGEVTAVNTDLSSEPEKVNTEPYGAWIIKLKISNAGEAGELLTNDQYEALTRQE